MVFKELELYKEELVSKPALLVVNKMDLHNDEEKLEELKEQLQNPDGKFWWIFYKLLCLFEFKIGAPCKEKKLF